MPKVKTEWEGKVPQMLKLEYSQKRSEVTGLRERKKSARAGAYVTGIHAMLFPSWSREH